MLAQGALEVFTIDIRNSYIKVNWDTVKQTINVPLWGKVGDTARGIELTILQNGSKVIPNLEKVKLYWQKPDGTKGFVAAVKLGDFFYLESLDQMFTVEGTVNAEFELETSGEFLKSPTFYPIVETSLVNGVESTDQFSALQQALLDISTYEAQLAGKVDKVAGKGLSTNDFSNEYKAKIDTDIPAQLNDIEQDKAEKTDVGLLSGLLTTAKTSIVNAINELFNTKANKAQEAWITPTLLNGWYAIRPLEPPQYMKDSLGFVHLRGAIGKSAESASNHAFILPVGYRPEVTTSFTGVEVGASGFRALAVSISHINGSVDFAGSKTGVITWYTLSHTFKAV